MSVGAGLILPIALIAAPGSFGAEPAAAGDAIVTLRAPTASKQPLAAATPAPTPGTADEASSAPTRKLAPEPVAEEKLHARTILVTFAGAEKAPAAIKRSKAQARSRAEQVSRLARQPGQDFATMAKRYSDGATAQDGGVIPPFLASQVDPKVGKAVLALKAGQISTPIETGYGYFVFQRLVEPKQDDADPLDDGAIRLRGILISYSGARGALPGVRRKHVEAKELAVDLRGKALAPGADFAALARQYSEDTTAPRGGWLGELGREMLGTQAAELLFVLRPGEVSVLVESPLGFHIFKREAIGEVAAEAPSPKPTP